MDDLFVLNYFNEYFKNNKRIIKSYINKNILEYLNDRFIDSLTIKESLYRIKNDINIRPTCLECNNKVIFKNNKFNNFCSYKCAQCSNITKDKIKCYNIIKYGVDNVWKSDFIKNKIKATNLLKYGCEYGSQTNIAKKKRKEKLLSIDCRQLYKETCLNKYGVDSVFKSSVFKSKRIDTLINRYGKNINNDSANWNIAVEKQYITKKKNNSFNKSKQEDNLYEILSNKYGIENVVRQYKSDLYPFCCDFYIKSINTYIEYNGSWTHGLHPFDNNSEEDLNTLNRWKDKSTELNFKGKQKLYYLNAIKTWTIRDIEKRRIAKENNLNFIEIFNINLYE